MSLKSVTAVTQVDSKSRTLYNKDTHTLWMAGKSLKSHPKASHAATHARKKKTIHTAARLPVFSPFESVLDTYRIGLLLLLAPSQARHYSFNTRRRTFFHLDSIVARDKSRLCTEPQSSFSFSVWQSFRNSRETKWKKWGKTSKAAWYERIRGFDTE